MMLVKYTPAHYAKYLGQEKGQQLYDMMQQFNKLGIKVLVKPGSTLPTDKISQRFEAMELSKAGKISDIDLYKRMDFPNPQEMAKNAFLQQRYPMLLYPDLAEQLQKMGIPMFLVEPKEIMNYKDTPPDIKRQMEMRAGLQPSEMLEMNPKLDVISSQQVPGAGQEQGQQQPQPPSGAQQAIDQGAGGNPPPQQVSQSPDQSQAQAQSLQPQNTGPQQPLQPSLQQQPQGLQPQQQPMQNIGIPGQSMQQPGFPGNQQPQQAQVPDHTQPLLQGQDVPPFAGIDPSQYADHLKQEFEFMASDQFLQLPQEIQVLYAKHVMAERQIVMQGGGQNVS